MKALSVARLGAATLIIAAAVALFGAGGGPADAGSVTSIVTTVRNVAGTAVTTVPAGTALHASVVVIGYYGVPTGTATSRVWVSTTCSGTPAGTSQPTTLSGGGANITSLVWKPTEVGKVSFRVHYSGNATYAGMDGPCVTVTVTKVYPTVSLQVRNSSGAVVTSVPWGTTVHPHVTVTGSVDMPTGAVEARWYSNGSCNLSPSFTKIHILSTGSSDFTDFTHVSSAVGVYSYQLEYYGDTTYNDRLSPCMTYTVYKLTASFSYLLYSGDDSGVAVVPLGTEVHLGTTLYGEYTGGTPTGTIAINYYVSADCTGTPQTSTYPALQSNPFGPNYSLSAPGVRSWKLVYSGDSRYNPKTGPCRRQYWAAHPTVGVTIRNGDGQAVSTIEVGTPIHLRVVTAGDWGPVVGTLRQDAYQEGGCPSGPMQLLVSALPPDTVDDLAGSFEPNAPGTYSFRAAFTTDSNAYTNATSSCVTLTVVLPATPPPPTPAPTPNPTPAPTPQPTVVPGGPTPQPTMAPTAQPGTSALPGGAGGPVDPGGPGATGGPSDTSAPGASPDATQAGDVAGGATPGDVAGAATPAGNAGGGSDGGSGGGAGAVDPQPTTGAGDAGGQLPILAVVVLLLLFAALLVWWARRRSRSSSTGEGVA